MYQADEYTQKSHIMSFAQIRSFYWDIYISQVYCIISPHNYFFFSFLSNEWIKRKFQSVISLEGKHYSIHEKIVLKCNGLKHILVMEFQSACPLHCVLPVSYNPVTIASYTYIIMLVSILAIILHHSFFI